MSDGSALLESIRMHPTELTPKLLYLDWAQENPDAVRALIQSALEMVPRLALFGVGLGRGYDDLEPDPKRRTLCGKPTGTAGHPRRLRGGYGLARSAPPDPLHK